MDSNLVTPPDFVENNALSVLLVDPDHAELDAVIRFCQYADQVYNVHVYTPNMDNLDWLQQAVDTCDTVIVNSRSSDFEHLCLLEKTHYYGDKIYSENPRQLTDPLHFFAVQANSNK